MAYSYKPFFKVLVLGNSNVGKTSLVNRYVNNIFNNNFEVTIGAPCFTKDILLNEDIVTLEIYDTAGMERFQSLGTAFYRRAHCCILVFDVTNRNSFNCLSSWRDEFLIQANPRCPEHFPFVVLGNKVDDIENRQVSMREAQQWCKLHDTIYYETSAKDDSCVAIAFETVAATVLEARQQNQFDSDFTDAFVVVDAAPVKTGNCCNCTI